MVGPGFNTYLYISGVSGSSGHSSGERLKGAISVSSLGDERPKGVISVLVGDERPKEAISGSSLLRGGERLKGYRRVSMESFLMKGCGWFFRNSSLLLMGSIGKGGRGGIVNGCRVSQ